MGVPQVVEPSDRPRIATTSSCAVAENLIEQAGGSICSPNDDFAGLLVVDDGHGVQNALKHALRNHLPILATGRALGTLNRCLGGDAIRSIPPASDDLSIFIAPGAKLAAAVGGSGWIKPNPKPVACVQLAHLAPRGLAACWDEKLRAYALESKGSHWAVGIGWAAEDIGDLPKGFTHLFKSLTSRATTAGKFAPHPN